MKTIDFHAKNGERVLLKTAKIDGFQFSKYDVTFYLSGPRLNYPLEAKTFNTYCKNPVFNYPIYGGKNRVHPTQKHPDLFQELIEDNTNEGDVVFDLCTGGMTTALAAHRSNREYICCKLNENYYNKGIETLKKKGVETYLKSTPKK